MTPSTVKLLLVDDEARNLDVLESLLQIPDCELIRAVTAEAALMQLLTGEFAAIVLDVQMPGMTGIELAHLIKQRKRTQHIPIIFLTAYYQEDKDVLQGYGTGAVDYLTKPINPEILRSKIAVFVDLFRKTQALAVSNAALESEIAQRQTAEEALRRSNNELESRVQARTAELQKANEDLLAREVALRASEAQALAASRAKDDFLAALSHELRTPLNPVLLLASESSRDPDLPEEIRATFEVIRKNTELEARLIDDLLDLTAISRGKLPIQSRVVDVHAVLGDAVSIVNTEVEGNGLTLTTDFQAAEHHVWGDPVRLQQVFWNVLKNATKFTPVGGTIRVTTELDREKREVIVRIVDSGIGLSKEELEQVFSAFAQGEHAQAKGARQFGGLGLGLAISRLLIQMLGGRIQAFSAGRNLGAEFVVTLALSNATGGTRAPFTTHSSRNPLPRSESAPAEPNQNGRKRILLVEDHAATRTTLELLLTRRKYDVVATGSSAEARAAASAQQPDLLLADLGLPDGGGWALLQDLRKFLPKLPAIAISGFGMDEDLMRSREAGFGAHIVKPIGIESLETAIARILSAPTTNEIAEPERPAGPSPS